MKQVPLLFMVCVVLIDPCAVPRIDHVGKRKTPGSQNPSSVVLLVLVFLVFPMLVSCASMFRSFGLRVVIVDNLCDDSSSSSVQMAFSVSFFSATPLCFLARGSIFLLGFVFHRVSTTTTKERGKKIAPPDKEKEKHRPPTRGRASGTPQQRRHQTRFEHVGQALRRKRRGPARKQAGPVLVRLSSNVHHENARRVQTPQETQKITTPSIVPTPGGLAENHAVALAQQQHMKICSATCGTGTPTICSPILSEIYPREAKLATSTMSFKIRGGHSNNMLCDPSLHSSCGCNLATSICFKTCTSHQETIFQRAAPQCSPKCVPVASL